MNKSIYIVIVSVLFAGTILTGCESPSQSVKNADEKVQDAKQDLNSAQQDANTAAIKAASAEEWILFKTESEQKIKDNDVRIAELKVKLNKPGKILDPLYEKRINTLEEKNNALKTKIADYEKSQSDWEIFKREFNHDMDELGSALKDFTVDNKN